MRSKIAAVLNIIGCMIAIPGMCIGMLFMWLAEAVDPVDLYEALD